MNRKNLFLEIGILLVVAVVSFILFGQFDVLEGIVAWAHKYEEYEIDELLSTSVVLVFVLAAIVIRRWVLSYRANQMLETMNRDLKDAMDQIRRMHGILPFCSFCKKIRDDQGYWEQVDTYIRKHSEAEISHAICPDCFKKEYPEHFEQIQAEKNSHKTEEE